MWQLYSWAHQSIYCRIPLQVTSGLNKSTEVDVIWLQMLKCVYTEKMGEWRETWLTTMEEKPRFEENEIKQPMGLHSLSSVLLYPKD